MPDTNFTLGEHAEAIRGLRSDVSEIKDDVKTLLSRDDRRQGRWGLLAGISSGALAVIALVVSWIKG